ncbi:MAG: hypothetical protein WC697_01960 [Patescibacteria group bacterium]|jgi:hypothetical protein
MFAFLIVALVVIVGIIVFTKRPIKKKKGLIIWSESEYGEEGGMTVWIGEGAQGLGCQPPTESIMILRQKSKIINKFLKGLERRRI